MGLRQKWPLGILLGLALVLGFLPGLNPAARAEGEGYITFLRFHSTD